jgi:hypothetical protein
MAIGSILQIHPFDFKPSAPPAGQYLLYAKVDNTIYLQDSTGSEYAFGSTTAINSLVGEATGTGPGAATITLSNSAVIGKVLTGFTSGPNSSVLATDTILEAIQKLQAQVSAGGSAITSLTGDVIGTGPGATAATVAFVGGKSSTAVATSVDDTQAATALNTASTLVERDASGNFAANIITANLTGNVTGSASDNLLKSGDTMTGPLLSSNTTQSISKDTGSVILEGGLGVEKNINAGGVILASNISGTNTGDVTVTDSDTIDMTLTGQDIQADVRISDATLTSDSNGLKVGIVPAVQVSGLSEAAQDAVGSSLIDTSTINLTYDDTLNTISADVVDGSITDGKIASGIDASKIANGSVSNTEFQFINSLTSNAQAQLNAKLADPMTSIGDTIFRNALNATDRLPIGSEGQILRVSGGIPAWATISSSRTLVAGIDAATIQATIDLAVTLGPTQTNAIIVEVPVKAGGWTEDITLKDSVYVKGAGNLYDTSSVIINGSITFSPTSLNAVQARSSIQGIQINKNIAGPVISLTGARDGQLAVIGCFIQNNNASTSASCMSNTNTLNASLYSYSNLTRMNGTSGQGGTHYDAASSVVYVMNGCDMSGGTKLFNVGAGKYLQCLYSFGSCAGPAIATVAASGVLALGTSSIGNTQANSSGINLTAAGAAAAVTNTYLDVPTGTGYVVTGVSGSVYTFANNITGNVTALQPRNVKIKNTVTAVAYTTALTSSP